MQNCLVLYLIFFKLGTQILVHLLNFNINPIITHLRNWGYILLLKNCVFICSFLLKTFINIKTVGKKGINYISSHFDTQVQIYKIQTKKKNITNLIFYLDQK